MALLAALHEVPAAAGGAPGPALPAGGSSTGAARAPAVKQEVGSAAAAHSSAALAAAIKPDPGSGIEAEELRGGAGAANAAPHAAPGAATAGASAAQGLPVPGAKLAKRLPLLWRYLRHPLTGVRLAAAQCLARLAAAGSGGAPGSGGDEWLAPVLGPTLRLVFQSLMLEPDPRIRGATLAAWSSLLAAAGGALPGALRPAEVSALAALAATPVGARPSQQLLVAPDGAGGVAPLADMAARGGGSERRGKGNPGGGVSPAAKRRRKGGGSSKKAAAGDDAIGGECLGVASGGGSDSDGDGLLVGGNRGGK